MNKYQEDLLEIYNSLTVFNENYPVGVTYNKDLRNVVMIQKGISVNVPKLNHYCLGLSRINKKVLSPRDFDNLMGQLKKLIESGALNYDRLLISPVRYGFKIYRRMNSTQFEPIQIADLKIITSGGLIFKLVTSKRMYKSIVK